MSEVERAGIGAHRRRGVGARRRPFPPTTRACFCLGYLRSSREPFGRAAVSALGTILDVRISPKRIPIWQT